jgi:hypothetical protein
MFEESLDIRRRVFGEEHPDVAESLCKIGDMLTNMVRIFSQFVSTFLFW